MMNLSTLLNDEESRRFSFSKDFVFQKETAATPAAQQQEPSKAPLSKESPPAPLETSPKSIKKFSLPLPLYNLNTEPTHTSPRGAFRSGSEQQPPLGSSSVPMISPRQDQLYSPYPQGGSPRQHHYSHNATASAPAPSQLDTRSIPLYLDPNVTPEMFYAFSNNGMPMVPPQQQQMQHFKIQPPLVGMYPNPGLIQYSEQTSPRGGSSSLPMAQPAQNRKQMSNGEISQISSKRTAPIMSPPSNDLAVELSLNPTRFLGKFDILQVNDPETGTESSYFIGNQLAHHLHKENYNLFRSLSRKSIKMRRASKKEFEFLLAQEAVKFTVRCVTLVEFNPKVCDYILTQAQKLRPAEKRSLSPSHLLSDSSSSESESNPKQQQHHNSNSSRNRAVSLPTIKKQPISPDNGDISSTESMRDDDDNSISNHHMNNNNNNTNSPSPPNMHLNHRSPISSSATATPSCLHSSMTSIPKLDLHRNSSGFDTRLVHLATASSIYEQQQQMQQQMQQQFQQKNMPYQVHSWKLDSSNVPAGYYSKN